MDDYKEFIKVIAGQLGEEVPSEKTVDSDEILEFDPVGQNDEILEFAPSGEEN